MKDRQYPDGKISPDDEGEFAMAIAADHQHALVRVVFKNPVSWFAFYPDQARELARNLLAKASEVDKAQAFITWAIYCKPTDNPDKYVARKFTGEMATDEFITGDSLEEVRKALPPGLICLARHADDPQAVVETWI